MNNNLITLETNKGLKASELKQVKVPVIEGEKILYKIGTLILDENVSIKGNLKVGNIKSVQQNNILFVDGNLLCEGYIEKCYIKCDNFESQGTLLGPTIEVKNEIKINPPELNTPDDDEFIII